MRSLSFKTVRNASLGLNEPHDTLVCLEVVEVVVVVVVVVAGRATCFPVDGDEVAVVGVTVAVVEEEEEEGGAADCCWG